jgi:hypothetical protein
VIDTTGQELAGRYFTENIEPDVRSAGFPDDMIEAARARYIRDATANPEAMRQIRDMYANDRRTP